MIKQEAYSEAKKRSKSLSKPYFVVCESGEWDVASSFDLDTFYLGTDPEASFVDGKEEE